MKDDRNKGFMIKRDKMVDEQIILRGVKDPDVLKAMRTVERHLFLPEKSIEQAYEDHPVSIEEGQTISQPYIVAYMTEQARLRPEYKVLEIGTGSGYQTAVLAEIVKAVYSVEINEHLLAKAKKHLQKLGYKNVFIKHCNGYKGWEEHAPYDAIIVTAAPCNIPEELVKQLKTRGRMIIPVGDSFQDLQIITKDAFGIETTSLMPVRFVPMITGE